MTSTNKLIEVLDQQSKIYKDMLDISKNKTDVIVAGKIQELENITKVEQTLLFNMAKLEDELEQAIDQVKEEFNITEENITLSVIINYLSGEDKERLEAQRNQIYDTIKQLERVNKTNSQLIKNSLDYINFSINLLSNANSQSSGSYQQNGEISVNKASFFDKKL